ncbi:MAG: LysR family transcriptional regulator [Sphingomonadaceae bacterium]
MIQKSEQGVQRREHLSVMERVRSLDWDDLDLLCYIAKATSLRQAARTSQVSVNTIRTHLNRLEALLGVAIFDRSHEGVSLNNEGQQVFDIARERQFLKLNEYSQENFEFRKNSKEISICCSEGVAEFWLMSMLPELKKSLDDQVISFQSETDQNKIHSNRYDLCIGFERPSDPDAMVTKLATVHFMLFASPEYLKKYGHPKSFDDLSGHSYVAHVAPGIASDTLNLFVGLSTASKLLSLRVNTSVSLYHAVANGSAIAALPTFASTMSRHVVPLNLPLRLKFELWLSFRKNARGYSPVRLSIDWLRQCFNSKNYPWFADNFIHPEEFGNIIINNNEFDYMSQNYK